MKARIDEYSWGEFHIDLEAETIEEAATLTRMGINATRKFRGPYCSVRKDGTFSALVVVGRNHNHSDNIPSKDPRRN